MFRKPFRVCWLMWLLLGPGCALALEIGEIEVSSSLNQLFDAKIPLPKLTPEELSKISVKLGPPSMFKEFGLDRTSILAKLVFSIEYNAEGEVYVKVISTEPLREPSLGLLLEFGWPRGKTFREFTVFLDPVQRLAKRPADRTKTVLDTAPAAASEPDLASTPIPAPTPPSSVPAPVVAAAETASISVAPSPVPVEASPPPVKTYKPGDSYGPVAAGEGLWKIALEVRPDPGITPDQMMQALFRANPHAFTKSGIDGLKIGATLRIPALREIADFTGSATARRLAETEEAAISMLAETAKPPAGSSAAESGSTESQTGIVGPKVFPLEPPAAIEPTMVETAPLAAVESRVAETAAPPAVAAKVESPWIALPTKSSKSESVARPVVVERPVAPPVLEPVPAAPLLFSAVSEVMASAVKIPAFAIPAQIVPGAIFADVPAPPPARKSPEIGAAPQVVAAGQEIPARKISGFDAVAPLAAAGRVAKPPVASGRAAAAGSLPVPAPDAAADLLAALDARVRFATLDLALFAAEAKPPVTPLPEAEPASVSRPETSPPSPPANVEKPDQPAIEAVASPVVETSPSEAAAPPVAETSPSEAAAPPVAVPSVAVPPVAVPPVVETSPSEAAAPPVAVPPVVETSPSEAAAPPVAETVAPSAVDADVSPDTGSSGLTTGSTYKGGEQYGPVAPNERLWDIAAKVRPDPGIGKDVMMKALFMANPQAFSKPGMNQLKVGAVLRVPTLGEIANYTGSTAAKQLLEQQQAKSDMPPIPEAGPESTVSADEPKPASESALPVVETPRPDVASPAN